ncbi:hypothetical protein BsWGS_25080 [Bradybaena similaris]
MAGPNVKFLIGLSLLFIGTVLHTIGQSTPEWLVSKIGSGSAGLWEVCGEGVCSKIPNKAKTAELKACEAFAILGIFACLAGLGLALVNFVMAKMERPANMLLHVMVLSSSFALIFILICVVVWGVKIYDSKLTSLGYSFALSIVGGVLTAIGGVVAYVGAKQSAGYQPIP